MKIERPILNTSLIIKTFQKEEEDDYDDDNGHVEPSCSMKSGSFLEKLSKEYSVPWDYDC